MLFDEDALGEVLEQLAAEVVEVVLCIGPQVILRKVFIDVGPLFERVAMLVAQVVECVDFVLSDFFDLLV
jgi:hypothetical protein